MSAYFIILCYNVLEKKERLMKIPINYAFFQNNKCVEQEKLNAIKYNNKIVYKINDIQNIIYTNKMEYSFIRKLPDSIFTLDIAQKKATISLNSNLIFDIKVEKLKYEFTNNKIIIEYKLETDEDLKKLIITLEE